METNEELIKEARAFASASPLGKPMARELDKAIGMIRELADALEAATTEWDYGYRSKKTGNIWGSGSLQDAQLGVQTMDAVIVRRRPAGPWLPVEGEST